jgi:hypothetical protein
MVGVLALGAVACGGGDEDSELSAKVADNLEASINQLGGNTSVNREQIDCLSAALVELVGPEEVERALADPENYQPSKEFTEEQQKELLDRCNIVQPEQFSTTTNETPVVGGLEESEVDPTLLEPTP